MNGQEVLHCPQCGGNNLKSYDAAKVPLVLTVFFASTLIGIPIALAPFIAWLFIKSNKNKRFSGKCQECKHNWKLTEEKFFEYKQAIFISEKLHV